MPDLLHPQERDRLLAGLRRLLRPTAAEGRPLEGLAHDASPDAPLPTLDNAVAAEALAVPALRAADPALADAVLLFTETMIEETGPPPRGLAAPAGGRVEIRGADPRDLHVLTPWHAFRGDLARGLLRQRLREDDHDPSQERGREVLHTGNMVRLRPGGGVAGGVTGLIGRLSPRARTLDVEEAVTASGVEPDGDGALLWHESALRPRVAGLEADAGVVRYEYRVSATSPLLRLTVTLRAGRAGLSGVRLTTAADDLSLAAPPFAHLAAGRAGALSPRPGGPFAAEELLSAGATESLHLWQSGPPAEALAMHVRIGAPEGVFSARLYPRDGAPHWLVIRHALPDLPRGGTATLREDRLLTRGTAPDEAAAGLRLLRAPEREAGRVPGLAGLAAPLAAVAATLLNAQDFDPPLPRARLARLRELMERHLDALSEDDLPVAELAPLILALDAAHRADGLPRERRRMRAAAARLVAAASPDGVIGGGSADAGAGHGAALLALARAAAALGEPWIADALRRALAATRPDGAGGGVALAGLPPVAAPTTRALSALLRGVRAAELVAAAGVPLGEEALSRAAAARESLLQALSVRLRPVGGEAGGGEAGAGGDPLEVLSGRGGEADALSAASLLLAVLAPDEAALLRGKAAA